MLRFFVVLISLSFSELISKDSLVEHREERQIGERYGFLNLRKEGGPDFISINPSVFLQLSSNMTVRSPFGSALMESKYDLPVYGGLETRSNYFPISELWGFSFNARTYEFDYGNQIVRTQGRIFGNTNSNEDSSNSPSGSSHSKENLGSRIRGRYSHAFPAIYFGNQNPNKAKMGLGVGPSEVRFSGTANYYRSANPIIFRAQNTDRNSFLNEVGASQIIFGNNPTIDPIRTHLLANLAESNNLELLGTYLVGKGDANIPNLNLVTLLQIDYLLKSGHFTAQEIYTLLILNNGLFSQKLRSNATWTFFIEIPFESIVFRLQLTSPIYYSAVDEFRFSFIDLSAQIPIDF